MKKRILCAILSLILLVSLIPTGALTASAASNSVSERAITVLKQLQGYKNECSQKGYWGYGTKCTEKETAKSKHGTHKISEKDADKALREELKTIDKAVNSFASSNGLSLSQSKHDALVLFSYRNGTAWMSGTGDVKRAVTTGVTGNEFLNMFCNWQSSDDDNNRRLIEANMYLNGVYSSAVASKYIKVTYDPNGGQMVGNKKTYYYDYTLSETELPTPTRSGYTFKGWYNDAAGKDAPTNWVYELSDAISGRNISLTAYWQNGFASDAKDKDKAFDSSKVTAASYTLSSKTLAERFVYQTPNGVKLDDGEVGVGKVSGNLKITGEYIDGNGVKWCRLGVVDKYAYTYDGKVNEYKNFDFGGKYWVKAGVSVSGGGSFSGGTMDVTVTVTNSYVNSRANATIFSAKNGSYSMGDKLRIVDTDDADGFLWGQVAKSADDATPVGWVALMYTNYSSLVNNDSSAGEDNSTVIAKARINLSGNSYVNLRKGAGTDSQIVGALTADTMVDIYEIKYVNGHQWGRCAQGWFLLAYADVTRLVEESKTSETTQTGFTSYAFTGKIRDVGSIFKSPSEDSGRIDVSKLSASQKISNNASVTVTNVTADKVGNTWGKISQGWIMMFNADNTASNFSMDAAKFEVTADSASVRSGPETAEGRVDTLSKGTEFDVTKIRATADTIWGYSDKVGDGSNKTYAGWVNLSSRYVKRNNAPSIPGVKDPTGLVATVINVDEVNVRSSASIYGGYVCKLARGTTCEVLDGPDNGWYRLKISGREDEETWVYQQYLDVTSGSADSSSSGSTSGNVETGKGIIANTYSGVNMRQSAGIGGAFMMKILTGTAVEIQEVKQVGSSKWGKLTIDGKTGWVCMDYVTMISYEDIPGYSNGSSSGGSTVTGAQTAIYTGVVVEPTVPLSTPDEFSTKGDVNKYGRSMESGNLLVFRTTDINGSVVRELSNGDPITIHEILTVEEEYVNPDESSSGEYEGDNLGSSGDTTTTKKTMYWARINDGYVRAPGDNIWLDTLDEAIYTVVDHDKIYVYDDYDLKTNVTTEVKNDDFTGVENLYLKKGEKATVTNVRIVGNVIAGYVENDDGEVGWVNLSKLTKGSVNVKVDNNTGSNNNSGNTNNNNNSNNNTPVIGDTGNTGSSGVANNASGYKYTGKVINTNEVNVRSTASTNASITTTLKSGASLVIYETTISESMAWGRCDAGWVYLYYVDMTPAGGSAIDARVVYNDNTIIYTDSACSETAGTYARMAVIDIYEIVGKMARTDKGWVNTDNLL